MRKQKLALVIALLSVFALQQEGMSLESLQELNVNYMLRGYCYAGSRVKDKKALGGFASSENLPKEIESGVNVEQDKVQLLALPDEETTFQGRYKGMKLLLANTTGAQVVFSASDSRLYIVQEAQDRDGKWKPIEYLPSSWCGNSRHKVFLGANELWEFAAARYTGEYTTKMRFKLAHNKTSVYSNEFEGSVNSDQFTTQQGHKPTSIMDPYNN